MKKLIYLFSSMLLTLCAVTFTACGSDNDEPSGSSSESGSTSATSYKAGEAVDLGLSVKWADRNVGAAKSSDYGGFYAWGETEEKEVYADSTYRWAVYKEGSSGGYWKVEMPSDLDNIASTEYDVAHVKWGGKWRMPLTSECKELLNKCDIVKTMRDGHMGWLITGPNGNSIFMPTAEAKYIYSWELQQYYGTYSFSAETRCANLYRVGSESSYYLVFGEPSSSNKPWGSVTYGLVVSAGFPVRPVSE